MTAPTTTKRLSTIVKSERVRIHMVPGRYALQSRSSDTVPLRGGGFGEIEQKPIEIVTEGEFRMSPWTRFYDLSDPKDKAVIDALKVELAEKPHLATHVDYQIRIVGEYDVIEPWAGYEDMDVDQVESYWRAMPDKMRAGYRLEDLMKWELERKDEHGEPNVADERVKLLNKLFKEESDAQKDQAQTGVGL